MLTISMGDALHTVRKGCCWPEPHEMRGNAQKKAGWRASLRAEEMSVEDRGSLDTRQATLAGALWTTLWISLALP